MCKRQNIQIFYIAAIILCMIVFAIKLQSVNIQSSIFNLSYDSYLKTEQISNHDYLVCGYDSCILGIYALIILFNAVYYLFRKEKSFIVIILTCFIMIGRTMIYGSHLIYYLFPQISARSLFYIDNITLALLPFAWIAVTRVCLPVNMPKSVIRFSFAFTIFALCMLLLMPVTGVKGLQVAVGAVLLIACMYLIIKIHDVIIRKNMRWTSSVLISAGIAVMTISTVIDVIRIVFSEKATVGCIPIGFMILVISWEFYFTYTYEMMMKDRLRVLEELNVMNENNRKLELKYLKSQIRPHFIHNALNTIIAISRTDVKKSNNLLYEFSNYLRSCYDIGNLEDVMPIENEISFTKAYVALEQARFEDNLQVEYQLDDVEIDVPPLILQPLAENAIVHNQISREKLLTVEIYVMKLEDSVRIGVRDNGEGFEQEKIRAILSGEPNNRGVGLGNINHRLNTIYGTQLHIESFRGRGADVFMIIPIKGD